MAAEASGGQPRRIEIHLGPLCNNKCVFCVSADARDDKDPWARRESVFRELEHFRERGCGAVGFLGGEPTVYPWIVDCVAHAKKLGYERIALCTNGTRLSDKDFCRKLIEAGLSRVTISIHSHDADVEDKRITLVPGNFQRKIAGIRNLQEWRARGGLKDNVSLNPVLCRPTMASMEEYLIYFSSLGISDIRFNFIWPEGDVGEDPDWVPRFAEAAPHIARVLVLNERRLRLRLTFGGVPKCALRLAGLSERLRAYLADRYFDEASYDPPNDVSILSDAAALVRPPQRFVWQERKRDQLKIKEPSCRGCRHDRTCEGIWKSYVSLYGFEEFRPVCPA